MRDDEVSPHKAVFTIHASFSVLGALQKGRVGLSMRQGFPENPGDCFGSMCTGSKLPRGMERLMRTACDVTFFAQAEAVNDLAANIIYSGMAQLAAFCWYFSALDTD